LQVSGLLAAKAVRKNTMPKRAMSPCSWPGCPELTDGPGRCDEHRRAADRARGSGRDRGWTRKWAAFRKDYLGRHPVCQCGEDCCPGRGPHLATDVDHIDGSGRNGPRAYDESNLVALAHGCHSRKTVRADGGFGR
jgi:5-methylcytosine-specific restriction protein A